MIFVVAYLVALKEPKIFPGVVIATIVLQFKGILNVNLWITVLTLMLFGTVFGGPAGMAVATVVGIIRKRRCPRAADASHEGIKPILLGLVIPVIWLGMSIPFYVYWLNPRIYELLSRRGETSDTFRVVPPNSARPAPTAPPKAHVTPAPTAPPTLR